MKRAMVRKMTPLACSFALATAGLFAGCRSDRPEEEPIPETPTTMGEQQQGEQIEEEAQLEQQQAEEQARLEQQQAEEQAQLERQEAEEQAQLEQQQAEEQAQLGEEMEQQQIEQEQEQAQQQQQQPGGETVATVYFDFDSAELTEEAKSSLRDAIQGLEEGQRVRILGYTDPIGPTEYNEDLAQRRAKAVADFLRQEGFQQDVVELVAVGETQPEGEQMAQGEEQPKEQEQRAEGPGSANARRVEVQVAT